MRYFIHLAYNGTNYCGWQTQPDLPTVQLTLEQALTTLLRQPIAIVGCGRTDTGVHASDFYAHFAIDQNIDCAQLTFKLNSLLPADIAIFDVFPVRENACEALHTEPERESWFALNSYEDYVNQFYRTDHHWNYKGAYCGYQGLHKLLRINEACLAPLQEVTLSRRLTGSKASHAGFVNMWEYPTVYEFHYPELGVEYGHESEVIANPNSGSFSYVYFYGDNEALVEYLQRHLDEELQSSSSY